MRVRPLFAAALLASPVLSLAQPQAARAAENSAKASYRLSGAVALRPAQIWDDGQRTYIVWSAEAELPAVFSRGPDGGELLAEGAMRDGRYVLDRVHSQLIFRIDRSVARAKRKARR